MNKQCQQLIVDNHTWINQFTEYQQPSPCVFENLLHQVPGYIDLDSGTFEAKRRRLNNVDLQQRQFCVTHSQLCSLHEPVDMDVSGLPCPDNSRANQKRKFEEGDSGIVYITWSKKHVQNKTPLLVLENVLETCSKLTVILGSFCL